MATMTTTSTSEDNYDSYDDQEYDSDRPTERWAPLGAVSNPDPPCSSMEIRFVPFILFVA